MTAWGRYKEEMKEIIKKSQISYVHQYKRIRGIGQDKIDYFSEKNRKSEKNLEYFDMIKKYFKLHNIKMEKQTQYKVDMQDEKINIVKIDQ